MTITINETEALYNVTINNFRNYQLHWNLSNLKDLKITKEELNTEMSEGNYYLEITVKRILDSQNVKLTHGFTKKRNVNIFTTNISLKGRTIMDNRVLEVPSSTNIALTAKYIGKDAVFKFRYPIQNLLDLELPGDLKYTLCKNDENVFLYIYFEMHPAIAFNAQALDKTVSHGVKIPKGNDE